MIALHNMAIEIPVSIKVEFDLNLSLEDIIYTNTMATIAPINANAFVPIRLNTGILEKKLLKMLQTFPHQIVFLKYKVPP